MSLYYYVRVIILLHKGYPVNYHITRDMCKVRIGVVVTANVIVRLRVLGTHGVY